jgi:hypothetical protein
LTSGWLAAVLKAPIVRFYARTVGMQSLIGEGLMEVPGRQASTWRALVLLRPAR